MARVIDETIRGTLPAIIRASGYPAVHTAPHEDPVAIDERHVALPKLYGAPAYARPSIVPVAPVERPFDPDDLPLEADQTTRSASSSPRSTARPYDGRRGGRARRRPRAAGARARRCCGAGRSGSAIHHVPLQGRRRVLRRHLSLRGGVAQSVRAAGLYPAGSRFESWLPYHSAAPIPRTRAGGGQRDGRATERMSSTRRSRRSVVRPRWTGSASSHPARSAVGITAHAGERSIPGSSVMIAA